MTNEPTRDTFPNLGDLIRVVDLECVTNEMLAPLLAADDDGECVVLLDGRPSRWNAQDKSGPESEPSPGISDETPSCASCGYLISRGPYALIWKGSLWCPLCVPSECVVEVTSRGYWPALFELVAESLPHASCFEDRGST